MKMSYILGTRVEKPAYFIAYFLATDKCEYPPDPAVKTYVAINDKLYQANISSAQNIQLTEISDIEFVLNKTLFIIDENSCEWRIPLNLIPEISIMFSNNQKIVVSFLIENAQRGDLVDVELLQYPALPMDTLRNAYVTVQVFGAQNQRFAGATVAIM